MIIHSHSKVGKEALEEKEAVLIGLSIRNSYFKDENLHKLISWAKDNFKHIHLMCPDEPAIDTLMALGYPANKAKLKATLACNNLENKCRRIMEQLGIDAKFIRWDDIKNHDGYTTVYQQLKELYENNPEFHRDVRDTTQEVIENHGTTLPMEEAIDIGVEFFLKETAFILNAAEILGVPKSAYLYHNEMPVLDKLMNGEYGFTAPGNTGYIVGETDRTHKKPPIYE